MLPKQRIRAIAWARAQGVAEAKAVCDVYAHDCQKLQVEFSVDFDEQPGSCYIRALDCIMGVGYERPFRMPLPKLLVIDEFSAVLLAIAAARQTTADIIGRGQNQVNS